MSIFFCSSSYFSCVIIVSSSLSYELSIACIETNVNRKD
nr:MAG TPA: hypothetical protein [Caudoviricetes sp.]